MELSHLINQLQFFLPELSLLLGGVVVLAGELIHGKSKDCIIQTLTLALCFIVVGFLVQEYNTTQLIFSGSYLITPFTTFGKILVLMAGFFTFIVSRKYIALHAISLAEYSFNIIFSMMGMFVLLSAHDFLIIFLGLELLSFPLYILTGMKIDNIRSSEASFKYMIMGAFSSAIFLFGVGLIYGALGSTNLNAFLPVLANPDFIPFPFLYLGIIFILIGFAFKLSLVPFHAWTPDVYEGAPTPVTAFMSVTVKTAVFFLFIRIFSELTSTFFIHIIAFLAVISIVIGNFYGLLQENIKRLIAYSSIAHAGYIMLGFLDSSTTDASNAMMLYLVNYTFMNLIVLWVLMYLTTKKTYGEKLDDLRGIGRKKPWLGFVMIVALFSLAGMPPTPGFIAKFYIFSSALKGGYILSVIVALLSTLVSLYYYTKILVVMYMQEGEVDIEGSHSLPVALMLFVGVAALFYLAIFPNQILEILPALK